MGTEYDGRFYDTIRATSRPSARVIAEELRPVLLSGERRHVLDVGCGEGWFGMAFAFGPEWEEQGTGHADETHLVGVDGPGVPPDAPIRHFGEFVEQDLGAEIEPCEGDGPRPYDLAICLEVAEHLLHRAALALVHRLCTAAPVVLFSAAIPGQGGTGHVNCRWPSEWAALFAQHGYACTDGPRWDLWTTQTVAPWYRQNLLLMADLGARSDLRDEFYWCTADGNGNHPPASVIHPDLWMPEGAPGL
jgi:hypothetical protein